MSAVTVILSPFDAGRRGWRMGAGPQRLMDAGVVEGFTRLGFDVEVEWISSCVDELPSELRRGFALHRKIASLTAAALARQRFPVLLAGDCNSSIGVVAGLQLRGLDPAFVWCDTHADFHTPDTDPFGSLDSQGLSMLTGRSWPALLKQSGFEPLGDDRVALVGARALDTAEQRALSTSTINRLAVSQARDHAARADALAELAAAGVTHFHLDADVLDPDQVGPANDFAAPGGLLPEELISLANTSRLPPLASLSVASFDPSLDSCGDVAAALRYIVLEVVRSVLD